jgi:hypothetical protein
LIGEWGIIGRRSVACRSLDDAKKVWSLARNDEVAARRYAAQKCDEMYPGMEVSVDDASLLNNAACVRPRGDPDCRRVARGVVEHKATHDDKNKADAGEKRIDTLPHAQWPLKLRQ